MTRDRREKLGEYKTSQEEPDKAIKCFLLNKSRGKKKKEENIITEKQKC